LKSADLKKRIIDISYRHKLSHLGSCLTAVEIIEDIYRTKHPEEKFILSAGHAGLALYVVLEKYEGFDAENLLCRSGIHPSRLPFSSGERQPFSCSTGSLGMGITVAVGMALADRTKNVYCLVSDGEMMEGSCYEVLLNIFKQKVTNLKLRVNVNGYSAYKRIYQVGVIEWSPLVDISIDYIDTTHVYNEFEFLKGLEAHYHVLTEEEYIKALADIERQTPHHEPA